MTLNQLHSVKKCHKCSKGVRSNHNFRKLLYPQVMPLSSVTPPVPSCSQCIPSPSAYTSHSDCFSESQQHSHNLFIQPLVCVRTVSEMRWESLKGYKRQVFITANSAVLEDCNIAVSCKFQVKRLGILLAKSKDAVTINSCIASFTAKHCSPKTPVRESFWIRLSNGRPREVQGNSCLFSLLCDEVENEHLDLEGRELWGGEGEGRKVLVLCLELLSNRHFLQWLWF